MDCKNCVHVKACPKKDKPQKELCNRFDVYDEDSNFKIFERMMQKTTSIYIQQ